MPQHYKIHIRTSCLKIYFLDITILKETNGQICTTLYYKPTDSHKYLLYSSEYSRHLLNSTPTMQVNGTLSNIGNILVAHCTIKNLKFFGGLMIVPYLPTKSKYAKLFLICFLIVTNCSLSTPNCQYLYQLGA